MPKDGPLYVTLVARYSSNDCLVARQNLVRGNRDFEVG